MFQTKGNQNTYFVFIIFSFENLSVYDIEWENTRIIEPGRPHITK